MKKKQIDKKERARINKLRGNIVRLLRENKNMEQDELAKVFGIGQSMMSQIESGSKGMSVEKIKLAADFFEIQRIVFQIPEEFTIDELIMFLKLTQIMKDPRKKDQLQIIKSFMETATKE